jgi:ribosomal protein S18 acetylase RimI-like enzyme
MVRVSRKNLDGRIRAGRVQDEEAVRRIADEVFTVFGEYGSWLPGYLVHPGVWSFVYELSGRVVGFAMLGILEPEERGAGRLGDLLAIAVEEESQCRGVGQALLERIREKAHQLQSSHDLREVRLTVAEPNRSARQLFNRFGFEEIPGNHGCYDKGQRALRLRLKIDKVVKKTSKNK